MHNPSPKPLNIVFAGTPEFAAHYLQVLLKSEHNVVAVYTQPDRPAGRGKKLTPSPVKQKALEHGLTVEQPLSLKSEEQQQRLANYQADIMIVVAYGLLLPQAVLDTPTHGCLNVHASLLPRWRGAAPIQRAVEAGDTATGITIMQMDQGLDTGDMLLKAHCDITPDETSRTLHDKLMYLGEPALLEVLLQIQQARLTPEKQNDQQACYADKISKEEAHINWQQSAKTIAQKIRAFNPFPVAYSFFDTQRIKIYEADVIDVDEKKLPGEIIACDAEKLIVACGDAALTIKTLQIPNKKSMSFTVLQNGHPEFFKTGNVFQ